MLRKLRYFFVFSCLIAGVLAPYKGLAEAEPAGRTMLVLDASGSMWGQIKGKTKIEIAREVVAKLVAELEEGTELGLVAYGHRRKGDCADIEILKEAGSVQKEQFVELVNKLNPKGKTPLSDAVIKAAKALRSTEEAATVVLVSDGIETCDRDPCAVGRELEKTGVDFTAHVIGFDVKEEEAAGLKCLAEETGGAYTAASDLESLSEALSATVKAPPLKYNLVLAGLETAEGPEIEKAIEWIVLDAAGEKVERQLRAKGRFMLPAGSYTISGKYKGAEAKKEITVPEGELVEEELVLSVGTVRLTGRVKEGAPAIENGIGWTVLKGSESGRTVSYGGGGVRDFFLSPGEYVARGRYGKSEVTKPFTITAGETTEVELVFGTGTLVLSARQVEGGPLIRKGMSWTVREPSDAQGKGKTIAYGGGGEERSFTLPAGSYEVLGKYGKAEAEMEVTVVANESVKETLLIPAGTITLRGFAVQGGKELQKNLGWTIAEKSGLEGKGKTIAYGGGRGRSFIIPPGEYVLEAKWGRARTKETVTVAAAKETAKDVVFNAGIIVVSAEGDRAATGRANWSLIAEDNVQGFEKGKAVAYGGGNSREFIVPAGNYRLVGKLKPYEKEQAVTLKAGERKEVAVSFGEGE